MTSWHLLIISTHITVLWGSACFSYVLAWYSVNDACYEWMFVFRWYTNVEAVQDEQATYVYTCIGNIPPHLIPVLLGGRMW